MTTRFYLQGNNAHRWFSENDRHFLGFFFGADNHLYRGLQAIEYLEKALLKSDLKTVFSNIDGNFCFITAGKTIQIVSDTVNFFPIFYSKKQDELILSDSWNIIVEKQKHFKFNKEAEAEFETAGFVLSDETLAENILKTNANEILMISNEDSTVEAYRDFIAESFSKESYSILSEKFEVSLNEAQDKMINFLGGRTAIVPLSGGYDSRLIISMLKKANYKMVLCFTYGKPNPEVNISRLVAETLDYEWHFIDFTKIDAHAKYQDQHFKDYLDFAGNGFAMPYLMEYFAVAEMKAKNLIPEDAVFLPGHSGDFLGGSYIKKTVNNSLNIRQLPKLIESKYFIFIKKNQRQKTQIQKRIAKNLLSIKKSQTHLGYNMTVEQWDIQEKLSKFIFHSSQVFNFFSHEVYFPLWDKKLRDFFRNVPFEFRENKKLYDDILDEKYFKPLNISFLGKELKASTTAVFLQKIKDAIRYFFPWEMVLKRVNNADWPHYRKLTLPMLKKVEKKRNRPFKDFKTYNAVICAWYLEHIKEKYSK